MSFLTVITQAKGSLRHAEVAERSVDLKKLVETEPEAGSDNATREYFFDAAVDKWYDQISDCTFRSHFVTITEDEGREIIRHWRANQGATVEVSTLDRLSDLAARIDTAIRNHFSPEAGVFVKLSTRSPKDSFTVFRKAEIAFTARLDADGNVMGTHEGVSRDNSRLVAFSEEMVRAAAVHNGHEALTILLDSWRVAEDLIYAIEEGDSSKPVTVVIREWFPEMTPLCEFRAFIWDRRMNAVGQYWHSLYFPSLQDPALRANIAQDLHTFFEKIGPSLPVPNSMLDLAWLGPGRVLLVEVNPLAEGLGSFRGSTGLFDYYKDADLLQGRLPFELRVREKEEERRTLINIMNPEWRRIVLWKWREEGGASAKQEGDF
jgi:hypothetical protein